MSTRIDPTCFFNGILKVHKSSLHHFLHANIDMHFGNCCLHTAAQGEVMWFGLLKQKRSEKSPLRSRRSIESLCEGVGSSICQILLACLILKHKIGVEQRVLFVWGMIGQESSALNYSWLVEPKATNTNETCKRESHLLIHLWLYSCKVTTNNLNRIWFSFGASLHMLFSLVIAQKRNSLQWKSSSAKALPGRYSPCKWTNLVTWM
jgi:hypothetical protein